MLLFYKKLPQRVVALAILATPLKPCAQPAPVSQPASPMATVAETGPHQRVWQRSSAGSIGATASRPGSPGRVVEIATGMNYWDGQQWVPSDASFEVTEDGFVATRLQHKVLLSGNLNRPAAVIVTTGDGITLRSTPVGIGLYDAASGRSAVIAAITDCAGVLLSSNQVVYENAFKGVCADVIYRIDRGSFEQDVLITGRLDPSDYGFPTNTTRLQIFTEFYEPPQPDRIRRPIRVEQRREVRDRMVSPDFEDEVLGFGEFVLATGRALEASASTDAAAAVAKQFMTLEGRTVLIESVESRSVLEKLKSQAACNSQTAWIPKPRDATRGEPAFASLPQPKSAGATKAAPDRTATRTARVAVNKRPGVVIDYVAIIGGTLGGTTVFQGDTTYFISGPVFCNGSTTIEGGAVFKYPHSTGANATTAYIKLNSSLVCKTSSYRPAIFTAADDNTIGEVVSAQTWRHYTGNPQGKYYANPALWVYNISSTLANARFSYAQEAIRVEGSSISSSISHVQWVNCIRGVVLTGDAATSGTGGCGVSVTLNNNLMAAVQFPISIDAAASGNIRNCTFDQSVQVITFTGTHASFAVVNSIFANVSSLAPYLYLNNGVVYFNVSGNNNGFFNSPQFGSSAFASVASPFQNQGAGNYYLATGSNFRNAGTTGVGSLLNELKKKTTDPPMALSGNITIDNTLSPQARRDTDTPDLGYHYDPLDWAVNGVGVDYATLTLVNGVAISVSGNSGILLRDGARLISEGSPLNRNHISRYTTVQEQPIVLSGAAVNDAISLDPCNTGIALPALDCRFTDFDGTSAGGYHLYSETAGRTLGSLVLRDCQFNGGWTTFGGPNNSTLSLNNNLFERVASSFLYHPSLACYNNLFKGGMVYFERYSGSAVWTVKDNCFDNCQIQDWSVAPLAHGYNAYINTSARLTPSASSDRTLTSLTYLTGALGGYYQPNSSPLRNVGSRTADLAGLYHHTTTIDQVREAATQVDIGFHYVSTNCGPVDVVWVDDTVPPGATQIDETGAVGPWAWVTSNPSAFSASQAHASVAAPGLHQHYFYNSTATLAVNSGDMLLAYVFIDGANLPTEIMLQWRASGSWEHRAYWGANNIFPGVENAANRNLGPLPAAGQWVRLEVPADLVGLESTALDGMAFTVYGGRATWDYAGKKGGNLCYDTDTNGIPDFKQQNPVIALSNSLSYTEDQPAVWIDATATVTDADSPNMAGGNLVVEILAPAQAADLFSIQNQGTGLGQIGVSGSTVSYGGLAIGTFTGGSGVPLRVSFNGNPAAVTLAAVQTLVRNVTYRNTSQNFTPTTARPLRITIDDGHGGSGAAMKNLTVVPLNDAPTLSSIMVLAGGVKNTASTITYDALAAAANEADVDSSVIHFRVESVSSGTLQKSGAAIVPGTTLLSPGQSWVWTPAPGVYGSAVNAFTLKAYDGTLASASPVQVAVAVANVNIAPAIGLPTSPSPEFIKGGAAILIDPAATVTDPDSVSFEGAVLTVAISRLAMADDRLAIQSAGQIGISGNSVSHNGTTIGTFSGGNGLVPLVVQFNAAATLTSVQALLRNLTYQNVLLAAPPGARTVRLVLTDGDGGTSPPATKTINVTCPGIDVMLVLDRSNSMQLPFAAPGLEAAKAAAKQFASYLDFTKDQCGIVSFATAASNPIDLTLGNSLPTINSRIDAIAFGGNTCIGCGIDAATAELASARHRVGNLRVMVLLTDGADEVSPQSVQASADAAKNSPNNIRLITVGLGAGVRKADLISYASSPEDFYDAPTTDQLAGKYAEIAANLCRLTFSQPVVSAGPDKVVHLPGIATLEGSVTDDGNTGNGIFNLIWSVVSVDRPGNVVFANASAAVTTAAFSAPGQYVLRLTGQNPRFSGSDDVVVSVYEDTGENQPPRVRAYPVERVLVGGSTTLRGSVQDDGLPAGSTITKSWAQVAGVEGGPARVNTANPSLLETAVGPFTVSGRYRYRLTASDGQLGASDDVLVTVCNGDAGPMDVMLVMDNSGSMGTGEEEDPNRLLRFVRARTAAKTFLDFINPVTDQVGLIQFSSVATLASELTADTEVMRAAITRMERVEGSTDIASALYAALGELISSRHRPGSTPVVVLLSDGYPDDAIAAMAAANQLKNAGVRMVTIALVPADQTAARDFLQTISSSVDDAYTGLTEAELSRIYASIAESFCLGQNRRPLAGIEGPPELLINQGDILTLRGTATDDTVPSSALTYRWTQSGVYHGCDHGLAITGTATFGASAAQETSVTFSGPGYYVLRFNAYDLYPDSGSYAELGVLVNDVPSVTVGASQSFGWTGSEIVVPLSATVSTDSVSGPPWICPGVDIRWSLVSGLSSATIENASSLDFAQAHLSRPGRYVVRLSADDGYAAASADATLTVLPENSVDAGTDKTGSVGTALNLSDAATNPTATSLGWTKEEGPVVANPTFSNPNLLHPTVTFPASGSYILRLTAAFGATTLYDELTVRIGSAGVQAGPDITIPQGGTATLSGTAISASGTDLAAQWFVVGAPTGGQVTFANANSKTTTATFNLAGTYQLRLKASCGADDLLVFVNQPPIVDAGPDQTVVKEKPAELTGSIVSDDLLPPNALPTVSWSKLSGPGIVAFQSVNSLKTFARFSVEGIYVLKLSVSDTQLSGDDTVTVKVVTPPVARNDVFLLEQGNEPFILDVLRNDTDPEGDPLVILNYDTALGVDSEGRAIRTAGTLALINNDTQFLFLPEPGARYTSFSYRIADRNGGESQSATVSLQIVPPPHAPKAKSDVFYTSTAAVDERLSILENDDDGGYGPLSIISYTPLKEISGGSGYGALSLQAEQIVSDPAHPFSNQRLLFTADPAHPGVYTFKYTVRNQKSATTTGAVILVVEPASDPNSAPIVDAGEDQEIYINQPLIMASTINNDPGDWIQSVVWSCSSPNVTFDNTADPETSVHFTVPGDYSLRITVTDGGGKTAFDEVFVRVRPEGRPPVAEIFNLANDPKHLKPDPIVTEGLFELRGRATDPNPANAITYRIGLYRPATIAGNPDTWAAWLTPSGDTQGKRTLPGLQRITGEPGDDLLGQLDFTRFPNDVYILTLEVWGGNVTAPATAEVRFALNSELQLGRLTFSEEDLAISASGFPMRLVRSYDSTAGNGPDFGWGWKYELKDLEPQLDEERSVQSFIDDDTGTWTTANVRSGGGRNLTLTLPDGRRVTYRFGFRVSITTGYAYAEYTSPPGVHSQLRPEGDNRLVYLLSAFARHQIEPFWQDGGQKTPIDLYEFPGFVLKMEDGTEYHLEAPPLFQGGVHLPDDTFINPRQPLRLSQILRPNGEKMMHTHLSSADDAVETYDAQGNRRQTLLLKRDAAGRVIKAIDALSSEDQPAVEYLYDTSGRLQYVRRLADRSANRYDVTTYFYGNTTYPNRITQIKDPRQVIRTEFHYFPDGKLEKIVQPGGETRFQHDLAGMKETITDPVETQTVHTFDAAGRITETEVKDALGNRLSKVVRSYDTATTLLTSQSVFLRRVGQTEFYANTYFEYDAYGNVNKVTDPNSFSTRFTYNQFGQVTSATDPREKTLQNDYDYRGNFLDTTDAEGGNTHNTYVNDRLESSTSPVGALTSYTYYAGEPGGAVGDLKTVTVIEWDAALSQNVTLSKITYTYDANSNVQSERQERKTGTAAWSPIQALITTYTYDAQNRVVLTRVQADPPDPQIDSTSGTSYNSIGKPETSTDRLGRVTSHNYDACGNLVQTVYPGSTVYPLVPVTITRTVYDAAGRACYIQDQHDKPASGNSSTAPGRHLVYDGLGRVVRTEQLANLTIELTSSGSPPNLVYATRVLTPATTPPAAPPQLLAASETRYDDAGRVYATAQRRLHPSGDPNLEEDRSVTTHAYDDAGRRLATYAGIDDDTGTIVDYRLVAQYDYDDAGNLKSVTDALHTETQPRVTEFEYDAANRQVLTRFPQVEGESTRATRLVEYDKAGRRIAETDELNRTTRFKYDGLGRLCQVTDPDLRITTYKYDWTGNLLEQTDALNHTTSYRYDALGRRLRRTLPGQQFESCTYDVEGNRLTQTDFEQKVTTFTYDVLRRLRKITPDAAFIGETPVQFEYYANGRRRQMMDASGQTDYDYDAIGRLKLKTTPRGRINYTYNDTSGRRSVAVTTANQNGSNRTGLGGTSLIYRWNSLNQLVSVTDGTATTTYDYDRVGNLENINYPIPAAGSQTHYIYDVRNRLKEMTVGSATLARYVYGVAANGRRSTATESGSAVNMAAARTVEYSYDNLDRLTRELIAGDEGGKNGELAYRYDDAGNRTWTKADPFGNTVGATSTFDENDRLGSAANYDKNGNALVSGSSSYQYDFQNRLQRRTGGAEVVHDGDGNLASRTLGGVTICYLVDDQNPTGHAQVIEELAADGSQVRKRYTWGLQLVSQKDDTLPAGDQVSYSGLDGHGNVRFLLKADGTARADRYVYDACGRMIRSVGTTPNVYLYCGERWDPDLGLYYLRARYLNPVTGRFMTMDTFEGAQTDPLSLHKYLYTHANPVNGLDPSGHMNVTSFTVTMGTWGFIAANLGMRALPALNRATVILYEASTGNALLVGGAGAGSVGVLSSQLRNLPGVVKGIGKAIVQGNWLRGSHGNLAPVPKSIAKQMSGRSFPNFDAFREAFWKLVAEDSKLATEFSAQNIARMKQGLAPIAHSSQQVAGRISYELHHIDPIQHGGEVYNLDNIVVLTPRYHQEVLEASFHY